MYYIFAFPPSLFYNNILPQVVDQQSATAVAEVVNYQILAMKAQLDFMSLNNVFYPKHFSQLKNEIKQLEIYLTDIANEV